jgi:arginyl-tRNA--protein-N-Asp/Glu arginylyltransferase
MIKYLKNSGMIDQIVMLEEYSDHCHYFFNRIFRMAFMLIPVFSNQLLEQFMEQGYRHFGPLFFRPACESCHDCIPIRIPLEKFSFTRSARRLFNKNALFSVTFDRPAPISHDSRMQKFLHIMIL